MRKREQSTQKILVLIYGVRSSILVSLVTTHDPLFGVARVLHIRLLSPFTQYHILISQLNHLSIIKIKIPTSTHIDGHYHDIPTLCI